MADKLYDALTDLIEKGGAAFPFQVERNDGDGSICWPGMTLRDFYAAHAMQAFIPETLENDGFRNSGAFQRIAESSYAIADAMMKVRAR